MKSVGVFLLDGFEETEGLTTVDILRRGGVVATTVSLSNNEMVRTKNNIYVKADALFENAKDEKFDMIVIPGGTIEIANHIGLRELIRKYDAEKKLIAAICAAPAALGKAGILHGVTAVCYPGLESWLEGANIGKHNVETDGHITTAKGPAITPFFAVKLLEILCGKPIADEVAESFLIPLIFRN